MRRVMCMHVCGASHQNIASGAAQPDAHLVQRVTQIGHPSYSSNHTGMA